MEVDWEFKITPSQYERYRKPHDKTKKGVSKTISKPVTELKVP